MEKQIFVSEMATERRIAVHEDNKLVEFYIEKPGETGMVGNIYKGIIENVLPGMQAAFVDIGFGLNAFLPFTEINNPELLKDASTSEDEDNNGKKREKKEIDKEIQVDLEKNQEILVQVIKEPFSGKGPRITTNIAIPGHLVVLVPNSNFIGISKKIWDKYEKRRIRKSIKNFLPNDIGIIVRTEAEGKSEKLIKKDFDNLLKQWRTLSRKSKKAESPSLLYEDLETVSTIMRDILDDSVDKFLLDSKKLFRQTKTYLQNVSPNLVEKLEIFRGKSPLFSHFNIDDQISKSTKRHVWIKSGAYLIIEHTEAMVVIDVNSGRFVGKGNHESNSLKINLQAAKAAAEQLRLRDIGGLVVIDFIDMNQEANRKKVYIEMKKQLKKDRAKVAVSQISEFGLLEMTRQRIRLSLRDSISEVCTICNGSGRILSKDAVISEIDTWIRKYKKQKKDFRLILKVHSNVYNYLEKSKKNILRKFMWKNFIHIKTVPDDTLKPSEFHFFSRKNNKEIILEV